MLRSLTRSSRPQRVLALAVALAACLVVLVAPGPARAAAVPASPTFPSYIDPYVPWEPETLCQPTAKPGAIEFQRLLQRTYGTSIASNITRACSGSGSSGHHAGRAIDWMTNVRNPAQADIGWSMVNWLLATDQYGNKHAMARRLGLQYIIWDSKMFRLYNTSAGWTEYQNCVTVRTGPADDNSCHRNHVHFSFTWAGAEMRTSWYQMAGWTKGPCPDQSKQAAWTAPAAKPLGLVPMAPGRLLDSRSSDVVPGGCFLAPGSRRDVQVTGKAGVPSSGVAAVVLNVTAVSPWRTTWLTAFPAGAPTPPTSSVNANAGQSTAATVVVPVGTGGKVSVLNGPGATELLVDVAGYFPTDGSGVKYNAGPPTRVLDYVVDGMTWTTTSMSVPPTATAVVANVTLDQPSGPTFGSIVPNKPTTTPRTSSINVDAGRTGANRVITQVEGSTTSLFTDRRSRAILDVTGWYAPTGASFYPLSPHRVADSRSGLGLRGPLVGGVENRLTLAGDGTQVPAGATAVVVSLTATSAPRNTWVTTWQPGTPAPSTSDVNVMPGESRANLVIVPLAANGQASLKIGNDQAQVVVDVLGYYR